MELAAYRTRRKSAVARGDGREGGRPSPGDPDHRVAARAVYDVDMAGKQDFTEEEWEQLRKGATGAGLLVSGSDPGFLNTF